MAGIDAYFSSIIWTKVIPLILIIAGLFNLWSRRKTIRLWYQNWLQTIDFPHNFDKLDESYRENLFSRLRHVKSGDFDLRNRGLVRVLEIGVGHGNNLKYLPLNCQLIVVEPNKFTRPFFTRNLKDNPLVNLIKYVEGNAEILSLEDDFPDEFVDCVISTGCLCACEDVGVVLAEVSRVLYHNGIFLYIEHTLNPHRRRKNILLMLLNTIWKFINGCNISINLPPKLQKHFNQVHFDEIRNHSCILDNIIIGSATKLSF